MRTKTNPFGCAGISRDLCLICASWSVSLLLCYHERCGRDGPQSAKLRMSRELRRSYGRDRLLLLGRRTLSSRRWRSAAGNDAVHPSVDDHLAIMIVGVKAHKGGCGGADHHAATER